MSSPVGPNKTKDVVPLVTYVPSSVQDVRISKQKDSRIPTLASAGTTSVESLTINAQEKTLAKVLEGSIQMNFDRIEDYANLYSKALQNQIENQSDREDIAGLVDEILEQTLDPFDVFNLANELAEDIEKVFKHSRSKKTESVIGAVDILSTTIEGAQVARQGVDLIILSIQLKQATKLLSQKLDDYSSAPSETLSQEIKILKTLIEKVEASIKDQASEFGFSFSTVALKTIFYMSDVIEKTIPHFSVGVGSLLSILDIVQQSVEVHESRKAIKTHEKWTLELSKDERSFMEANDLLKQRQIGLINKKIGEHPFSVLNQALDGVGVKLEEFGIHDKNSFDAKLDSDDGFRNRIFKKFVDENDEREMTIQTLTRQGLDNLATVKVKNERKFFEFNKIKSALGLSLATLSAALTLTLEILAIVGVISLAATSVALPMLGLTLLGVGLTVAGLIYFYRHRPNLFKCFIKGVNLRIRLFGIIAKIRELQLISNQRNISKLEKELVLSKNNLDLLIDQKRIKKLSLSIHKKEKELEKIKINTADLEQKRSYWLNEKDGKLTKLKRKISDAANKDFEIATRLRTYKNDENGKPVRESLIRIIAEGLLVGKGDFDKETLKVLKNKMGIDLDKIPKVADRVQKSELLKAFANYFKMDESELLVFMEKQMELKTAKDS